MVDVICEECSEPFYPKEEWMKVCFGCWKRKNNYPKKNKNRQLRVLQRYKIYSKTNSKFSYPPTPFRPRRESIEGSVKKSRESNIPEPSKRGNGHPTTQQAQQLVDGQWVDVKIPIFTGV